MLTRILTCRLANPVVPFVLLTALVVFLPRPTYGRQDGGDASVLPTPDRQASLRFQHLGIDDGLSQSAGASFLQDRNGFLWIGTRGGGLNKFDGRSFEVFRPTPGDSMSLSNAFPRSLFEDSSGRLWAGTDDGLNLFNPNDETFSRFLLRPSPSEPNQVLGIAEDAIGNLWIYTLRGLMRRDAATGAFTFEIDGSLMRSELLPLGGGDVVIDQDGYLWLAAGPDLWRYDPESSELRKFISDPSPDELGDDFFSRIVIDAVDPDILWTVGTGLYRLNRQDGSFRRFLVGDGNVIDNAFLSLAQQPREPERIWLAGFEAGLAVFDVRNESFTVFAHDPTNPDGPASDELLEVYFDNSGLMWVGTRRSGVDRVDLEGGEFGHVRSIPGVEASLPSSEVRGIAESRDGTVWVSTPPRGFVSYDQVTGNVTRYDGFAELSSSPVWYVEPSSDGSIWFGLQGGPVDQAALHHYDPSTGAYRHVPESSASETPQVGALLEEDDGKLWIGHFEGLDRFDPATGSLETDILKRNVNVSDLYKDERGRIWITTRNAGMGIYDAASGAVRWFEPDPANPKAVPAPWTTTVLQRRGIPDVFWISMYGGGLARFDERTGQFKTFTVVDGLPDNVVYGILEDDDGLLWMSTNRGLSRFNPEDESFQNYGTERGIQSWEFNQLAFHRSPSTGLMYFGGVNGFNVFDPNQLATHDAPPQIAFTNFLIHNRVVEPGADSPLKTAINLAESITLAPDQNGFGFEFAAMDFKIPGQNRYRYKLEGFDEDWIDGGRDGKAAYTNLRSGTYTFRVHGTNSNGHWSEEPASITVTVLPPWWQTWWAYTLYVLGFAASVVAVDRIQRRRLLTKERERTQARELEQAREIEKAYVELRETKDRLVQQEKLASLGSLTAGIAHEIKNPLNFVTNFAELNEELVAEALDELKAGKVDDALQTLGDVKTNTSAIAEHGKRADGIVKGMMAHASGASGQRESVDLNGLVSEYVDLAYHGKRAQSSDFNATITKDLDNGVGDITIVAADIGRVILNLAGNAFDAVTDRLEREGAGFSPTVAVTTSRRDGQVVIRVADNGGGVPKDVQDRIFEPFFTTKPTGSGTGLGLSLSYDIVTVGHAGSLTLESHNTDGAAFVITLPTA